MARKPIKLNIAPEDMTPDQRAQAFSEGTYTATQTGAAKQARNPLRLKKKMTKQVGDVSNSQQTFDDYINKSQ